MKRDAAGCAKHGTEGADGYRVRMKSGVPGAELRLTRQHLVEDARDALIEFDDETGAPQLATPIRMSERDDCVIELAKLKPWMQKRGWRDRFMLWVCDWGWTDLTASRSFVMSFSPNMKAAYERYGKVCVAHELCGIIQQQTILSVYTSVQSWCGAERSTVGGQRRNYTG